MNRAAFLLIWMLATCTPVSGLDTGKKPAFELSARERAVVVATNLQREMRGLKALKPSEKLFKAARQHSANMAKQGTLAHELDGKGPGERLKEAGYQSMGWGENCAMGQRTPSEAVATWMESEGHRANLLNDSFEEIGIGIAADAQGQLYLTQVFAAPRK